MNASGRPGEKELGRFSCNCASISAKTEPPKKSQEDSDDEISFATSRRKDTASTAFSEQFFKISETSSRVPIPAGAGALSVTSDTTGFTNVFLTVFSASLERPTAWYASSRNFNDADDFSFVPETPAFCSLCSHLTTQPRMYR